MHVPRSWMGFYYQRSGNRLLNRQIYYFGFENNGILVDRPSTRELLWLLIFYKCYISRNILSNKKSYFEVITSWEISILIHPLNGVSQKEIEKGLQNLLHPGFCSVMTGLNREKRCKLAAVFADKLIQCSDKVASKIVPVIFLRLYPDYIYFSWSVYLLQCLQQWQP